MSDDARQIIQHIGEVQAAARWDDLEPLLSDLAPLLQPDLVAPLLITLIDDVLNERQMFGVVHLAETINDRDYVRGLLAALPALSQTSPRWSRTLLARALNSPSTFTQLLEVAQRSSFEEREAVSTVARSLEEWRPERFAERSVRLRDAFSNSR